MVVLLFGSGNIVISMPMASGAKDGESRAFKFATLSIVGQNVPPFWLSSLFERVQRGTITHQTEFTALSGG